jgi:signal transduction histidine kinase
MRELLLQHTNHSVASAKHVRPLVACLDWSSGRHIDHSVQFYEDDDFLMSSIVQTLGTALRRGEGCIVFATADHLDHMYEVAEDHNVDLLAAARTGAFVRVEAAGALERMQCHDNPDWQCFTDEIGELIDRASRGSHAPVRIVNEIGALLWQTGNRTGSLSLERFWNDLAKTHTFSLHCAYSLSLFNQHEYSELFKAITAEHDRALPTEHYITRDVTDPELKYVVQLQQQSIALRHEANERAKLELALHQCQTEQEQLSIASAAKDDFLSIASHQLRTPATAVKQYLGLLLEGYDKPLTVSQRAMLQHAYDTNERQLKTLTDLLMVARVDSGRAHLDVAPCGMPALLRDVVADHKSEFAARSQEVTVAAPTTLTALADERYIRMAIDNLVDNASKYSQDGKPIRIIATLSHGMVSVAIRDHGIGISKKDVQRLGQKFVRIENQDSSHVTGTGLGIYWAKGIIELHGGELTIASRPGQGSTFTILLPTA